MVAPGILALVSSRTTPEMLPVVGWAMAAADATRRNSKKHADRVIFAWSFTVLVSA
jgi:hypothetical protein